MNHLPEPVDVFIPAGSGEAALVIHPGSAIAGRQSATTPNRLDIYFQDDWHGSLPAFADRAMHAAARMVHSSPTIARLSNVPAGELTYVGIYDDSDGEILLVDDDQARDELRVWLGLPDTAALEAACRTTTSVRHQQRRDLRAVISDGVISPVAREFALRYGHEDLLDPTPTQETR